MRISMSILVSTLLALSLVLAACSNDQPAERQNNFAQTSPDSVATATPKQSHPTQPAVKTAPAKDPFASQEAEETLQTPRTPKSLVAAAAAEVTYFQASAVILAGVATSTTTSPSTGEPPGATRSNTIVPGKVTDIIFGRDAIRWLIVNTGQQYQAVPWVAFQWDSNSNTLLYNQDLALLQDCPKITLLEAFDVSGDMIWEKTATEYWTEILRSNPGVEFTLPTNQAVFSYNSLMNPDNDQIDGVESGRFVDLILDPMGAIRYVLVQQAERYIPVPWEYVTWDQTGHSLIYQDDQLKLDNAPSLPSLDTARLSKPSWNDAVDSYWGITDNHPSLTS